MLISWTRHVTPSSAASYRRALFPLNSLVNIRVTCGVSHVFAVHACIAVLYHILWHSTVHMSNINHENLVSPERFCARVRVEILQNGDVRVRLFLVKNSIQTGKQAGVPVLNDYRMQDLTHMTSHRHRL